MDAVNIWKGFAAGGVWLRPDVRVVVKGDGCFINAYHPGKSEVVACDIRPSADGYPECIATAVAILDRKGWGIDLPAPCEIEAVCSNA